MTPLSTFQEAVACIAGKFAAIDADVAIDKFEVNRARHDQRKRVVFVPVGGTIEAATRHGRRLGEVVVGQPTQLTVFEQRYRDRMTVAAHMVAESFEDTILLRDEVLRQTHASLNTASTPGTYRIVTQEDDHASVMLAKFEKIIQLFEWDLNIDKTRDPGVGVMIGSTQIVHEPEFV
jgi:hypothetical protein